MPAYTGTAASPRGAITAIDPNISGGRSFGALAPWLHPATSTIPISQTGWGGQSGGGVQGSYNGGASGEAWYQSDMDANQASQQAAVQVSRDAIAEQKALAEAVRDKEHEQLMQEYAVQGLYSNGEPIREGRGGDD